MLQSLLPTDSITWNLLVQVYNYFTFWKIILLVYLFGALSMTLTMVCNCIRTKWFKNDSLFASILMSVYFFSIIFVFWPATAILYFQESSDPDKDIEIMCRKEILYFLPILSLGLLWFV